MSGTSTSKRGALIRNTAVFQLKLMADGFRDLVLLPVALIASLIGLVKGGDEPEREFNRVLEVGRASEKWINLFGNHKVPDNTMPIASIDALFAKVEKTLQQQYQTTGTSQRAQAEIDEALKAAQDKVTGRESEKRLSA